MAASKILSLEFFPRMTNRDDFFDRLLQPDHAFSRIVNQYLQLAAFTFLYGAAMGAYNSLLQAIVAGIKVVALFSLVLLICFPAFFIIQFILGSRLSISQMISIVLSGFVLTGAIMLSFIPVVVFFLLTGGNYYFLQLLHIAVFILAGLFGMKTIIDALQYSCEKRSIYPHTGVVVFRFWVVIMAFVGIQLAWNLRPFMGDREEPFMLFRHYEGNFYAALIYSVEQLAKGKDEPTDARVVPSKKPAYEMPPEDSALFIFFDTTRTETDSAH